MWVEFCNLVGFDIFCGSQQTYLWFSQWLANKQPPISGNSISHYITAVNTWHKELGYVIDRKPMKSLHMQVKALKKINPINRHKWRPIIKEILWMWLDALDNDISINNYDRILWKTVLCVGYNNLLRPGEMSISTADYKRTPAKRLNWNNIHFVKNDGILKALLVTLGDAKTSVDPYDDQIAMSPCTCPHKDCAPHNLITYKNHFITKWGIPQISRPLFVLSNGKWLYPSALSDLIKHCCDLTGLDPKFYRAHGLRSGKCTDLYKSGATEDTIQLRGRWVTATWKEHYRKLDFTDVLKLSKDNNRLLHN